MNTSVNKLMSNITKINQKKEVKIMYNTRRFCVEVVFPCSPEKIKLELYETYVSYMAKEKYNIHNICSRLETKYEYKNWFDLVRIGAFVSSVEFNLSIPNQPGDPTISKD